MNTTDMNTTDMNTVMNTTRTESLASTRSLATDSTRRDVSSSVDFPEPAGVMAHLAAVGVEPISIAPVAQFNQPPTTTRPERNETS